MKFKPVLGFEEVIFLLTLVVIFAYGCIMGHAILGYPMGYIAGSAVGVFVIIVAITIALRDFKRKN